MIEYKFDRSTGIIEMVIRGDITSADVQDVTAKLERQREDQPCLLVLQVIKDVGEVEPSPYWESVTRLIQDDDPPGKAAIVTDRRWKMWFNEMLHPFVGSNMRIFGATQIEEARAWLRGEASSDESPPGQDPAGL